MKLSKIILVLVALSVANIQAAEISRVMFVQFMKKNGPTTLCSSTALLGCMKIPQQRCLTSLNTVNDICATKMFDVFPESFTESEENARYYGREYSYCLLDQWKLSDALAASKIEQCFGR